ncbi:uncharacterized protein LOC100838877 [Brachypodium distachyon]|uniref:Uncharacterized protein n=1 Tax=Brachypodium distachyon TaxID=15368 RepID=I1GUP5_BRADI|nr:uncharacterized protein LOC100838877 [Brachypodium distachyon]KQK16378.1 hypothetical protein BRADI_1g28467v3 [Brachypodium distachyon]|eukprot:XP_003563158.1 uncharacterized protein LOC100838877 [Brachypodium distachyon]
MASTAWCIIVQVSAILLNLTAFGLAIAAEHRRSKATVTPDPAQEYGYCVYDSDVATGYGVAALLLLTAVQVLVMVASRCFCSRGTALVLLFFSSLTFLIAAACLLAGSVRNAYHTRDRGIINADPLSCETLRKGVFAAGAAFTFFTAILTEFYYISYSTSRD